MAHLKPAANGAPAPRHARGTNLLKLAAAAAGIAAPAAATSLLLPHAPSEGYPVFEAVFAGIAFSLGQTAGCWAVGLSAALVAVLFLRG